MKELLPMIPPEVVGMIMTLLLAFFIGLEREEHKQRETAYAFGGVRTFPLIGLVSFTLAALGSPGLLPWLLGFAIVGGFMLLSYRHKLTETTPGGLTTELSAMATYVIGGLVQHEHYWIATTVAVVGVLLLELKLGLEGLAKRFGSNEIVTLAKFLVVLAVVLPIVPDDDFTRFHINPFKTWVVVVAVSGVSFASYGLQRLLKGRGGLLLSAILGGAYSSTVTTVVLSRQAREARRPNVFAASILTASGVMYVRLVLLLALFNAALAKKLAPSFFALAAVTCVVGFVVSRRGTGAADHEALPLREVKNPLELGAAFVFAAVFVVVLVVTNLARQHLGHTGFYTLAVVMGVADVDPFMLGIAQQGGSSVPLELVVRAVVVAAASNNAAKAVYSFAFADRDTGRRSLSLLLGLAVLGLLPLAWL